MSRRRDIVAVIASSCLALGGVTVGTVAPAVAASTASTATAPRQLVNQYPLGPQRLCCSGQDGSRATTGSSAPNRSATPTRATSAPGRGRTPAKPTGHGATGGGSAALLIGFGALAVLLVTGAAAAYRTRRRTAPVLGRGFDSAPLLPDSEGVASAASLGAGDATSRAEPRWDRSPAPPSEVEEREFRRLDANGDADGAFNLGVVLHQRGDIEGATAAYERAEERGDADAAFNLGVLAYEAGHLDGAEAAWQRSAGHGHVRAAANLVFLSRRRRRFERGVATESEAPGLAEFEELSYRHADEGGAATGAFNLGAMLHQQGDTGGALAAYERAERRGDPDAAFNLGVLLYEIGDLDGAEGAWRRSAGQGHARAAENLEFLLRHRHELETAPVAGAAGDDR
jgi:tetratricopeptide (TPR) repeat protein